MTPVAVTYKPTFIENERCRLVEALFERCDASR